MNKGFRIEKRRIGKAVVYMVLILLALYTLFPLLILVINSFKPHTDIIATFSLAKTGRYWICD